MSESQQDIDALLDEVNALAEEAVASIGGREPSTGEGSLAPKSRSSPQPVASRRPPARASGRSTTEPAASAEFQTPRQEDVSRILDIAVPIIVRLSQRTMPLSEILNLTTGSIIEFDKPADSDLELLVNNKCIGNGQAVKVGENFGLRVVRIGSVRERIHAMAGR